MKYPLEERTFQFSKRVIFAVKELLLNITNKPIIQQLVRSDTSVGANYCEANGASSRPDFKNKIHISKKEALESRHWLRLLAETNPNHKILLKELEQEAKELGMIFSKIISTLNNKN